jgi:hypothetical protein
MMAGYHNQDDSDDLRYDPLFNELLVTDGLASQPTISRFMNRLNLNTSKQLEAVNLQLLDRVYEIEPPEQFIFDADSSEFPVFGKQYGRAYNGHYKSVGFHPLMIYNGLTGDYLKGELRSGNVYTSRNICRLIGPLITHFAKKFPDIERIFRGDSGFADSDLYEP